MFTIAHDQYQIKTINAIPPRKHMLKIHSQKNPKLERTCLRHDMTCEVIS